MGSRFAEVSDPCQCGKGMVYDRDQLELRDHQLIKLPQLESLSWLERRYIAGGVPDQRFLQVASFHSELGPTTFVNFHLDTAGGNGHRRVQVEAIADFIRSIDDTIVVCGDTNAFAMSRKGHPKLLRWLLEPIAELGIEVDTDDTPTHFFARQHEPLLTHRLTVWAGKIGIDFPRRYDVVGSNATVLERGVRSTRASDHDLVWAKISG